MWLPCCSTCGKTYGTIRQVILAKGTCSTIGVKDLDMNSQTHKNGALITASYNMTSQAEVNRTGKSELSSSILQE